MNDRSNQSWIKILSVPNLEGVRTLARSFSRQYHAPRHVHNEYIFSLAIEGTTEFDCGHCGERHILQPNDLLLTEAHEVYASRTLGKSPWRDLSLSVSKEKLNALLASEASGRQIGLPHFTRAQSETINFGNYFSSFTIR